MCVTTPLFPDADLRSKNIRTISHILQNINPPSKSQAAKLIVLTIGFFVCGGKNQRGDFFLEVLHAVFFSVYEVLKLAFLSVYEVLMLA